MSKHEHLVGKELPYGHHLQFISVLLFLPIWILDSFIFKFTVWPARFIPWVIRLILSIFVIIIALVIMHLAEKILFKDKYEKPTVIDKGILAHVRHPLYLGILLIYFGLMLGTFSMLSLTILALIFFLFNKMATFEEKDLERIFGDQYLEYKRNVPKWIPRL